jgi:hypothetical protein
MGIFSRLRSVGSMVKGRFNGFLDGEGGALAEPEPEEVADGDEVAEDPPITTLRLRVTVPELPATEEAPKRERAVYYVYGQTQEEALARLPADLRVGAAVESAGRSENGKLILPESEQKV